MADYFFFLRNPFLMLHIEPDGEKLLASVTAISLRDTKATERLVLVAASIAFMLIFFSLCALLLFIRIASYPH